MATTDANVVLDRLLVDADVQPWLLSFAAALSHGWLLAGSMASLTDRVSVYPVPVAEAVVRRYGQIDNFWRWRMYSDRGDPYGLRVHFATAVSALTHILCALNGRWWPGPKWPSWALSDLAVAPPRLWSRLTGIDRLPPAQAAAELAGLVEETYDLVEARLPAANAQRLRDIFRFQREPWPAEAARRSDTCPEEETVTGK